MSPDETKKDPAEYDVPHHRISIELGGQEVGYAEMLYFSEPTRFFYLDFVRVKPENRGLRLGSYIVESVNKFLDQKKLPGVLMNIIKSDEAATGIYERHGWQTTEFDNFMIYSPRKKMPSEMVKKMVRRINGWCVKFYDNKRDEKPLAA
jgi:ribosomal protein S18 acetylase RimI-like enzyme